MRGFTLIELMVVSVVIGIFAAAALPSYASYLRKSRARSAGADLATLALNMDNKLQLQLVYPVYQKGTAATNTLFPGWSPSMQAYFSYTVQSSASAYHLEAKGLDGLSGCTLTLESSGKRAASADCGFSSW